MIHFFCLKNKIKVTRGTHGTHGTLLRWYACFVSVP